MSHEDDAAKALEGLVPLGADDPVVQQMGDALMDELRDRRAANGPVDPNVLQALSAAKEDQLGELIATTQDASGVARPGDVLLIGSTELLTQKQAEEVRALLLDRLPGIGDVVIMSTLTLQGIYRGNDP